MTPQNTSGSGGGGGISISSKYWYTGGSSGSESGSDGFIIVNNSDKIILALCVSGNTSLQDIKPIILNIFYKLIS